MMFRLGAVVCFLLGGLRFLGIAMELAGKQWRGAAIDITIAALLFGIGAFLWKMHRQLTE